MIVYQQAFDLYHTVYRMINILGNFKYADSIELDRLRIWDYYLLFPSRLKKISLKSDEREIRTLINDYISREQNPYEQIFNDRKMLEKIRPFQMGALKYLASIGLIDKDYLKNNKITKISNEVLLELKQITEELTSQEKNTISLLTGHFFYVPLTGKDGLKSRSNLLESRYDA